MKETNYMGNLARTASWVFWFHCVFLVIFDQGVVAQPTPPTHLYISQIKGVAEFRIPSMITTQSGVVLAVCDARVDRSGDVPNNVDQVIRRSKDGGQTWEEMRTIVDFPNQEGAADPQLLQDKETGRIFLFYVYCPGRNEVTEGPAQLGRHLQTQYIFSDDEGLTWSLPVVVEYGLKKEGWHSLWPSPGRGIQLENGRLIAPVTVYDFDQMYASYMYSDDHGDHWEISSLIASGLSEAKLAELDNGTLMINSRNATGQGKRAISTSTDQGKTWSKLYYHPELTEPGCNGSFVRVPFQNKNLLIFANPDHPKERKNMTIKVSFDQGNTWPVHKTIFRGPSAYSCLTILPDGNIGLLYENGEKTPYERISFVKFSMGWLMEDN